MGRALIAWWREHHARFGWWKTARTAARETFEFLRDSMPQRLRQRWGDIDYDLETRADTTSARLGWKTRLLGALTSPYQPTDPALFREMMECLGIRDWSRFTFIDLGSGKGRTLLMAAEYPLQKIIGVELLPELHEIAQRNVRDFRPAGSQCRIIEARCGDARSFEFPPEPTILYLFNPLPQTGLEAVIANIADSLQTHPRPLYVIYHNPLLEPVLASNRLLSKRSGTAQYVIYSS